MSRSYRDEHIDHKSKLMIQKNLIKSTKTSVEIDNEDGVVCPNCKKFCTYIYLARHPQCYNCKKEINLDE